MREKPQKPPHPNPVLEFADELQRLKVDLVHVAGRLESMLELAQERLGGCLHPIDKRRDFRSFKYPYRFGCRVCDGDINGPEETPAAGGE